jgi:predicted NBD/HSP70 family sugar kinase
MQIHSVGIDLGKTTLHLVALGAAGKVLVRKNMRFVPIKTDDQLDLQAIHRV